MEEFLAVVGAILEAFRKNGRDAKLRPGARPLPTPPAARTSAGRTLRDLLAERAAAPVAATAGTQGAESAGAGARRDAPGSATAASPLRVERPLPAAARGASVPPGGPAREAGLVRGIFADPQTLVAAFIAAEVLAPPVALRSGGTARGTTAL